MRNSLPRWISTWAAILSVTSPEVAGKRVLNTVQASALQGAAELISQGSYQIRNVGTGESLVYTPVGNHIAPASGPGSVVELLHYGVSTAWVRLQCLSSQWGGSYDHAAVMYACAVSKGGATVENNVLEPTKQWWLLVPVGSDLTETAKGTSNQMLVQAQRISVKTREDAIKAGTSHNAFKPGNSKRGESEEGNVLKLSERRSRRNRRGRKHKKSHRKNKSRVAKPQPAKYWIIP
ncbi:hypothetical protein P7C70_g8314, partial [Phenoliferia sp. Uapishka_3]